jgi:hypothetical protein
VTEKKTKTKSFGEQVLGGPLEYQNKTCFGKSKRSYQNLFYRRVFAMPLEVAGKLAVSPHRKKRVIFFD